MSFSRTAFAIAVIATSVLMHLGLLGVIVMAERRGLSKPETQTIQVELVKPEELPQELKQELKQEQKLEEPKKKKDAFKFDLPEQQKPNVSRPQQQQNSSQPAAQLQPNPDPKAQQQSAKDPLQASLEQPSQPEEPAPPEEKPVTPSGGPPSDTKAKLTPEEIAAFRAEIQKCWELPVGMPDAMKLDVVLRVGLSRKGTLVTAPELLKAPASVHGPRLVGIAMKAVSGCGPYKSLPTAKYNEWKVLDLRFLATGMSGLDTTKVDVSKLPRG